MCDWCPAVRATCADEEHTASEAKFKAYDEGFNDTKINVVELIKRFRSEDSQGPKDEDWYDL